MFEVVMLSTPDMLVLKTTSLGASIKYMRPLRVMFANATTAKDSSSRKTLEVTTATALTTASFAAVETAPKIPDARFTEMELTTMKLLDTFTANDKAA